MRVIQAVFGVFHHFELAHQLHRRGHLHKIYTTWPWTRLEREGLPHHLVGTFPLLHTAEYLLGRTSFTSPEFLARLAYWNTLSFDRWTNFKVERDLNLPDVFIAISGAGLLTGKKVQERGGKFVCDRGSTHQRYQNTVVWQEHERWGLPKPVSKLELALREEAIYAQADAITVPSSAAKRSFVEIGIPADKVHVIPYGVRLDRFSLPERVEDAPSNNSFDVLFAGSVSLRKGVPYLLQAFARLNHAQKRLTLAGSVSAEMHQFLARLPHENVTFLGAISQQALANQMKKSHVLVLPSVEEGLALVQAQAMACGCPVIATEATGARDLFTDGVEGFIVPDRDIAAMAIRMQQLADDPALRSSMSLAANSRVQTMGGWDAYGDRWDDLLHRLTGLAKTPV